MMNFCILDRIGNVPRAIVDTANKRRVKQRRKTKHTSQKCKDTGKEKYKCLKEY